MFITAYRQGQKDKKEAAAERKNKPTEQEAVVIGEGDEEEAVVNGDQEEAEAMDGEENGEAGQGDNQGDGEDSDVVEISD